jgi:hypothetical protein
MDESPFLSLIINAVWRNTELRGPITDDCSLHRQASPHSSHTHPLAQLFQHPLRLLIFSTHVTLSKAKGLRRFAAGFFAPVGRSE